MRMQEAMKNPNVAFVSPESLVSAADFSPMQKRAILIQWRDELRQSMVADEENMPRFSGAEDMNAECMRRVTDAISRLTN